MKKRKKNFTYILGGMIIIALLVVLVYIKSPIYKEKKQEEAIKQTELYLAENYQDMNYEILNVDSSTDFGYYGYFEHAVTVLNNETKETFEVYYDKSMDRMEDSIKLDKTEKLLMNDIKPEIEKYVKEHFGETRYIDVGYYMETGKPMIHVMFEEKHDDITQKDFDSFVTYLQETHGFEHANVIVDYWNREVLFQKDY